MATTIQISEDLLERLKMMKISDKESYENIIWDLVEDSMEISEETKKNIAIAEKELKKGKVHRWEDVKKELNINVRNNCF
jgi:predicted CopG family antitoxin